MNKINKATLKLENCIDCPFHKVEWDPDPNDWFCDDDVKVVCMKANRDITVACRPHNKRKECEIPNWCPLIKKHTKETKAKISLSKQKNKKSVTQ